MDSIITLIILLVWSGMTIYYAFQPMIVNDPFSMKVRLVICSVLMITVIGSFTYKYTSENDDEEQVMNTYFYLSLIPIYSLGAYLGYLGLSKVYGIINVYRGRHRVFPDD